MSTSHIVARASDRPTPPAFAAGMLRDVKKSGTHRGICGADFALAMLTETERRMKRSTRKVRWKVRWKGIAASTRRGTKTSTASGVKLRKERRTKSESAGSIEGSMDSSMKLRKERRTGSEMGGWMERRMEAGVETVRSTAWRGPIGMLGVVRRHGSGSSPSQSRIGAAAMPKCCCRQRSSS